GPDDRNALGARHELVRRGEAAPEPDLARIRDVGAAGNEDATLREMRQAVRRALVPEAHVGRHDPCAQALGEAREVHLHRAAWLFHEAPVRAVLLYGHGSVRGSGPRAGGSTGAGAVASGSAARCSDPEKSAPTAGNPRDRRP